ncbi:hypothetical protein K445DRAFT_313120 [Daldinia sp. EC12]|nr:hypothetical protein K445DRAFT_313120 [Daldinia sp. EC12]
MAGAMVTCPYLVIAKFIQGSLTKAENEAFVAGRISLDVTWAVLEKDMVFIYALMPYSCNLYVMWREVEEVCDQSGNPILDEAETPKRSPVYRIRLLDSFSVARLSDAQRFRTLNFRIHRWAQENRLARIMSGLRDWEKRNFPRHMFMPTGR